MHDFTIWRIDLDDEYIESWESTASTEYYLLIDTNEQRDMQHQPLLF